MNVLDLSSALLSLVDDGSLSTAYALFPSTIIPIISQMMGMDGNSCFGDVASGSVRAYGMLPCFYGTGKSTNHRRFESFPADTRKPNWTVKDASSGHIEKQGMARPEYVGAYFNTFIHSIIWQTRSAATRSTRRLLADCRRSERC